MSKTYLERTISTKLTAADAEELERLAAAQGHCVAAYMRHVLRQHLADRRLAEGVKRQ